MSHYHITSRQQMRRGFTLIELLVVIVIIGILASLAFVGGREAVRAARRGIIKNEISQVEMALERYKEKFGEFPPDFSDEAAVMRHVRKRWPNMNWQNQPQTMATFCAMINAASGSFGYNLTPPPNVINDCEDKSNAAHVGALAFWLGGIPDNNGMLSGFSADVSNPLGVTLNGSNWTSNGITQWDKDSQFMDLTIGKNCEIVDGLPVITAYGYPIAYFKPNAAGKYIEKAFPNEPQCVHLHNILTGNPKWEDLGVAVPYAKTNAPDPSDAVWHNPKSYQLIHPGLDGKFGDRTQNEFRALDPAKDVQINCTLADNDNQANFGGTTIESAGN